MTLKRPPLALSHVLDLLCQTHGVDVGEALGPEQGSAAEGPGVEVLVIAVVF